MRNEILKKIKYYKTNNQKKNNKKIDNGKHEK